MNFAKSSEFADQVETIENDQLSAATSRRSSARRRSSSASKIDYEAENGFAEVSDEAVNHLYENIFSKFVFFVLKLVYWRKKMKRNI